MSHPWFCLPLLLVFAVPLAARAENAEDAKLAALFRKYLDEEFHHHPFQATSLGDHRFDDQLDDLSPEARAADLVREKRWLSDLPKEIDYAKLTRNGQIDFEIFQHELTRNVWLAENTKPFEEDPRTYGDYVSTSVFLLFTQSSLPKDVNARNAAARITHIPQVLEAARRSLKRPPRVFTETAIRQNRGAIAFYEQGVIELAKDTSQVDAIAKAARPVVAALQAYQKYLEKELLPRSTGDWRLGRKRFARKLELDLNSGQTPYQVMHDAEAEATRVEGEMYVIARQLWAKEFPKEPLPPDDERGRRDIIARVLAKLGKSHGTPESLVGDAKAIVARVKRFIAAKDIVRLPDPDRCQVIEMPEFQRGNTTAYLNPAPPLDPKAASVYAISPPLRDWDERRRTSYLEEYNNAMMNLLTIHEAYPGHYVQLSYANRCPSEIRKVLASGVFQEGWAVYTEQMMLDEGYGDGDLSLRLHQLKWYLRAVVNAILDYKMHCEKMTDAEALDLLMNRAFQSEGEAVAKVVRAKQSSCQLSTYFVGRMALYRLRQAVERKQGTKFNLGRYHEAVLAHGSVPVKYLPELVAERLKRPR